MKGIDKEMFGQEIARHSATDFFSVTDLLREGNRLRQLQGQSIFVFSNWLQKDETKIFLEEMEKQFGTVILQDSKSSGVIWAHLFILLDIARDISIPFRLKVAELIYNGWPDKILNNNKEAIRIALERKI